MSDNRPFNKPLNPAYTQAPPGNKPQDGKIYIGLVKNNKDIQRMGRLEVWIPEMGGLPDDSSKWIICGYASPFAGSSNVDANIQDGKTLESTQTSYGMWFVPPDLDNQVLVVFSGGEVTKAFWFACLWQQNMTHMVPGVASSKSYEPGEEGQLPPVAEYNKKQSDPQFDVHNPIRPRFDPLHEGLQSQGLYTDSERGPSSTSARREAPSQVFGILSPRANTVHFDDDPTNEFIRIRTRGGTQVLVHQTNGYVYINSKKGNSWIEVSDQGIDMYSRGSISARTEKDFNIRADNNVNIDAGGDVNIVAKNSMKLNSGSDMHVKSNTNLFLEAVGTQHQRANNIRSSAQTHDTRARYVNRDGLIYDNDGRSTASEFASTPNLVSQIDVNKSVISSPVSRMPTHEPWPGHGSSAGSSTATGSTSGSGSNINGSGGGPTVSKPPIKTQTTGDGTKVSITNTSNIKATTKGKPSPEVLAAIKKASSITGIDYGYLMAKAQQESSFDPNAHAPKGSASGLFQFTDGTWREMIQKYPQYGLTQANKNDPEINALAGALYAKENKAYMEKVLGRPMDDTDLYLGHFLGPGGATKFLSANADAPSTSAVSALAVTNNPGVFVDSKTGRTKTVQEVRDYFARKIEPNAAAYNAANNT